MLWKAASWEVAALGKRGGAGFSVDATVGNGEKP
jgi:hypothetical protein